MQKNKKKALGGISLGKKNKKEKMDEEIASLIKNSKKPKTELKGLSTEQESELEKDLEEDVEEDFETNLGDREFSQFMKLPSPSDGKAPVLERVAREAPRPIFLSGVPQSRETDSKEEDSGDFKYVSSNAEKNEPKYVESTTQIYHESERVDLDQVGRKQEPFSPTNQESFFTQSSEAKSTSQNPERAWRVDRFEVEKAGRKNPLERDEMKYEKYKPSRSK